jgi:hypothetical protein
MYCELCRIHECDGQVCDKCREKAKKGWPHYATLIERVERVGSNKVVITFDAPQEPNDYYFAQEMGWTN